MKSAILSTTLPVALAGPPQIHLKAGGRFEEKHDRFVMKSPRVDMDTADTRRSVRPFFAEDAKSKAFIPLDVEVAVSEPSASGYYVLMLRLFSVSNIAPESSVEAFMKETGAASKNMPLRYSALFGSFHRDQGHVSVDENGDSCIGRLLNGEFCEMAVDCMLLSSEELMGGDRVRMSVGLPVQYANKYHVEAALIDAAHLGEPAYKCSLGMEPGTRTWRIKSTKEAHVSGAHEASVLASGRILSSQVDESQFAMASLPMWLLYADEQSDWWAKSVGITDVASSWVEMMSTALAYVGKHGVMADTPGQFLEFGVAKGQSLLYLSMAMDSNPPPHASKKTVIHGFDSFEGLPGTWKELPSGSFSMNGEIPEALVGRPNVKLHKGWFNETMNHISDEDGLVAFAHIDVDMYESTIEVLTRLKCLLVPGSVVVFDEFFNFPRWSEPGQGEFSAWRMLTEEWGMEYEYLGIHFGQAVPLMITKESDACMLVNVAYDA